MTPNDSSVGSLACHLATPMSHPAVEASRRGVEESDRSWSVTAQVTRRSHVDQVGVGLDRLVQVITGDWLVRYLPRRLFASVRLALALNKKSALWLAEHEGWLQALCVPDRRDSRVTIGTGGRCLQVPVSRGSSNNQWRQCKRPSSYAVGRCLGQTFIRSPYLQGLLAKFGRLDRLMFLMFWT